MKKIALINACTDLGVDVDGAQLAPQILTQSFSGSNITNYVLKSDGIKEKINYCEINNNSINDFVKKFNSILLNMHKLHFESNMNEEERRIYNKKMYELVLAVKALDTENEKRNLVAINDFNEKLYNIVCKTIEQGEFPLTIGGDHIIAIASSLASIKKYENLGIIWFDSHSDFNTYSTSVTGNLHGLPLAVATHYEKDILSNFHDGNFFNPKNTVIVGGRDIDPWEWNNILDAGITVFSTEDIKEQGVKTICEKAFNIATNGTNGVHISFDLDLIDPKVAPGVSVPAKNGINLEQTYDLVNEILKYSNKIKSADLVEYNPVFDVNGVTEEIAKTILNRWIENISLM